MRSDARGRGGRWRRWRRRRGLHVRIPCVLVPGCALIPCMGVADLVPCRVFELVRPVLQVRNCVPSLLALTYHNDVGRTHRRTRASQARREGGRTESWQWPEGNNVNISGSSKCLNYKTATSANKAPAWLRCAVRSPRVTGTAGSVSMAHALVTEH